MNATDPSPPKFTAPPAPAAFVKAGFEYIDTYGKKPVEIAMRCIGWAEPDPTNNNTCTYWCTLGLFNAIRREVIGDSPMRAGIGAPIPVARIEGLEVDSAFNWLMDNMRAGVQYFDTQAHHVQTITGSTLGVTTFAKDATQVWWFPSFRDFLRQRRDVFQVVQFGLSLPANLILEVPDAWPQEVLVDFMQAAQEAEAAAKKARGYTLIDEAYQAMLSRPSGMSGIAEVIEPTPGLPAAKALVMDKMPDPSAKLLELARAHADLGGGKIAIGKLAKAVHLPNAEVRALLEHADCSLKINAAHQITAK